MIPPPTIVQTNPVFTREVDKRADAVCRAHSDTGEFDPCCPLIGEHWQEARRQLLAEWEAQA